MKELKPIKDRYIVVLKKICYIICTMSECVIALCICAPLALMFCWSDKFCKNYVKLTEDLYK